MNHSLAGRMALMFVLCLSTPVPAGGDAPPKDTAPAKFLLEWGSQGSARGEFDFPIGIAINRADEVFVSDHYNSRVQKFDRSGKLLEVIITRPNPGGICLDADANLYISHFGASARVKERLPDRISVHDKTGKRIREWGKTGTGEAEFDMPGGMASARDGRLYIADQTNRRIQVFDGNNGDKFLFQWGRYGTSQGEFGGDINPKSRVGGPQFVAIDSTGHIYTTEGSVCRVQKFTPDGKFLLAWGDSEDKPGSFGGDFQLIKGKIRGPIAICIDKKDRVWVSAVCGRVQRFTNDGKYLDGFGYEQGSEPGQFLAPHGLAIDSIGDLYVVDAYNHRVQKFAISP